MALYSGPFYALCLTPQEALKNPAYILFDKNMGENMQTATVFLPFSSGHDMKMMGASDIDVRKSKRKVTNEHSLPYARRFTYMPRKSQLITF